MPFRFSQVDKPRDNLNGIYELEITASEPAETSTKQPAVKLTLEALSCLSNPETGMDNVFDRVRTTVTIEKSTLWRIKPLAANTGVDAPRNGTFAEVSRFADELLGKKGESRVE